MQNVREHFGVNSQHAIAERFCAFPQSGNLVVPKARSGGGGGGGGIVAARGRCRILLLLLMIAGWQVFCARTPLTGLEESRRHVQDAVRRGNQHPNGVLRELLLDLRFHPVGRARKRDHPDDGPADRKHGDDEQHVDPILVQQEGQEPKREPKRDEGKVRRQEHGKRELSGRGNRVEDGWQVGVDEGADADPSMHGAAHQGDVHDRPHRAHGDRGYCCWR
mmetsp:Transcript_11959/g.34580  ORF Transcript_11959/g.34580 Transcript_11959/m.34580 type:complete len:220 (-) Transcript_11959:353-1012(-)